MTNAHTLTEKSKKQRDNIKTPPKTSITKRLRTDLGWSVGVTTFTLLVWLNRFTSAKKKYTEEDIIKTLEFLHFCGLCGKGFPTDNRHSHGHKLCLSPSRHISILVRSGIHTVLALGRYEAVRISVQLHIQIHR